MHSDPPPSAPRPASVFIALFLAVSLFSGFSYGDLYPFSHFPMYSGVRESPYEAPKYEMVGTSTEGNRTTDLTAPLGTGLFLKWVQDAEGKPEQAELLGNLLLDYNRRRYPELDLASIKILHHNYVIPQHPERVQPKKLDTEVFYETEY